MRKAAILALTCFSLAGLAYSQTGTQAQTSEQKAQIEFTENSYDFGTVKEESNSVSHTFVFKNTGNADLVLKNVRASCGCTTPQWSKEPVAPGATGTIQVRYSTSGRPGSFTKTITVNSNADRKILTIKGTVTPKGQTVEKAYPFSRGSVRLKTEKVSFGNILVTGSSTAKLGIANATGKEVTVKFVNLPRHITVEPRTLKANEWGNIVINYDGKRANDWGAREDELSFTTSDAPQDIKTIKVSAMLKEKFTTEQKANAPIIVTENPVNAGEVKAGKRVKVTTSIKNEGKSSLLIHKATSSDKCITLKTPKAIKPGKQGKLTITIDATGLQSNTSATKTISMICNDPVHPTKALSITYKVK